MGKQFFGIAFKEIDFCWLLHLVNKASNDYQILFSFDNHVTNKQSMPCSSHKPPNENVLHSCL